MLYFHNCIVPLGFLPWEIRVAFPWESQLRHSLATQPTVPAGCFSVSIIHRTLIWTTGSLTCTQMLMHAIAHGVVRTHVRKSALKVDSGTKIPCRTGESNLRQRRDGLLLEPTELHPHISVYINVHFANIMFKCSFIIDMYRCLYLQVYIYIYARIPLQKRKTVSADTRTCLPKVFAAWSVCRPNTGTAFYFSTTTTQVHTPLPPVDYLGENCIQLVTHPTYFPDIAPCFVLLVCVCVCVCVCGCVCGGG